MLDLFKKNRKNNNIKITCLKDAYDRLNNKTNKFTPEYSEEKIPVFFQNTERFIVKIDEIDYENITANVSCTDGCKKTAILKDGLTRVKKDHTYRIRSYALLKNNVLELGDIETLLKPYSNNRVLLLVETRGLNQANPITKL
jgi:hypothetical protein